MSLSRRADWTELNDRLTGGDMGYAVVGPEKAGDLGGWRSSS